MTLLFIALVNETRREFERYLVWTFASCHFGTISRHCHNLCRSHYAYNSIVLPVRAVKLAIKIKNRKKFRFLVPIEIYYLFRC